ncbi:MAG: hypothetical protein HYZ54_08140 [Ignavibacteriae bacterium]|nr:hypothetical protein [Ignavibacteriota bacterium]
MNIVTRFLKRKFRKHGVIQPEDEAEELIVAATASAFDMFTDKTFRRLIDFSKKDELEQNRIFNELTVTAIALLTMCLEDDLPRMPTERREFWRQVYEKLEPQFHGWLARLEIPKPFLDLWKEVLKMRLDEFKENEDETRDVWVEELRQSKNEALNQATVRIGTITVSAMMHLCRRDDSCENRLRDYFKMRVVGLNNKIVKSISW